MQHIGFIMDGNRTWAKNNFLPSFEGHRRGYQNFKKIIQACLDKSIPYVSFWALSDDNIRQRSPDEVKYLFDLLSEGMKEMQEYAIKKWIKIQIIGDRTIIRSDCLKNIEVLENITKKHTKWTVIIAIWYGWREEIARAVMALYKSSDTLGGIDASDIFAHLETAQFPQIDLIVRTGWHMRHSWFYLYQSPYAEYFFSQKNWPDFDEKDIDQALEDFSNRTRKFWK